MAGNQKKKTSKQPRNKKARKQVSTRQKACVCMSDCLQDYTRVLNNPFDAYSRGRRAGVPTAYTTRSYKVAYRVQGSMKTGTSGKGFVMASPYAPGADVAVQATGATSVGTGATALNAFTNLASDTFSVANSTYAYRTNEYKIVAMGLRLQYDGPLLDRGGTFYRYRSPHNDEISNSTFSDILTQEEIVMSSNKGQGVQILWRPAIQTETDFKSTVAHKYELGILVNGDPGLSFRYECVGFYEFVGTDHTVGMTHSTADPVGQAAASQVVMNNETYDIMSEKSILRKTADAVLGMSGYIYDHGPEIRKAANVAVGAAQVAGYLA